VKAGSRVIRRIKPWISEARNQFYRTETVINPCTLTELGKNNGRPKSVNFGNLKAVRISKSISGGKESQKLTICCLNARSVKNKTISLSDYIISNDFDIVAITETWLGTAVDEQCKTELVPEGYDFKHIPRQSDRNGGGTCSCPPQAPASC
jgi:hypothetical protein